MVTATKCPTTDDLRALSTGWLADEQSEVLVAHVRDCAQCRLELEHVDDQGDSLISSLRAPDADAAFDQEPECQIATAKALGTLAAVWQDPEATEQSLPPTVIGEYEVQRALGRGGMGTVFLARHTKLGRFVALKVLASRRLADPRMSERFEAEIRALGRLSHPNVVTAHDAREVDGTAVLVTEYVDGFDLTELVARIGRLRIADACEIARQTAVALAYVSDQGLVHRDVKPSNIMLSRSGEVKLLDLGLARWQHDDSGDVGMTGTGQTLGTADYVAPEQVTDSRSVDARADIYSLGCTLFKLLTGAPPFADAKHATAFAKMTAHVSETPPSLGERLPDAPAALVRLVDAMLAKDPARRPQSAREVAERLAGFAAASDLAGLAGQAASVIAAPADRAAEDPGATRERAKTLPLLRRPVSMWIALASGIVGLLMGICLGVIIKIERPDGTVMQIPVPAGSQVTMEDAPESVNQGGATASPLDTDAASRDVDWAPLQFAILVENPNEAELTRAKEALIASEGDGAVATGIGTWFPLAPDVRAAVEMEHRGRRYGLARNDGSGRIGWTEIQGRVSANARAAVGDAARSVQLDFSGVLVERMREITSQNIGRHLGVVIDGEIVAAPRVATELSTSANLVAGLSYRHVSYLMEALNGLVGPGGARAEGDSGSENSLEPTEATGAASKLQGLWRVASTLNGSEPSEVVASVIAFDGHRHYLANHYGVSAGTYEVGRAGDTPTISVYPEPKELPPLHGTYHFASEERLVLHLIDTARRDTSARTDLYPAQPINWALVRLGDVPRSREEAHKMYGEMFDATNPEFQVILTLADVVGAPPQAIKQPTGEEREEAVEEGTAEEKLQGLWRVKRMAAGRERRNLTSVFAFEGHRYYTTDPQFPDGAGTYAVGKSGKYSTISMHPGPEELRSLHGTYGVDDRHLSISGGGTAPRGETSGTVLERSTVKQYAWMLERIGDIPGSREEAHEMYGEKFAPDDPVFQAILTLADVVDTPPELIKPPTIEERGEAAEQARTEENLKAIGVAFHQFHSDHRAFPGSSNKTVGAPRLPDGETPRPFSWRVAILPYIGEVELYERYRFDQPWDSEHNRSLLAEMPDLYRSPRETTEPIPVGQTHYQGFVGERTALGPDDGFRFEEFTDGTSPTLLIVESRSSVPWTMPHDIPFTEPEDARKALPFENRPLTYMTADGAVHTMDPVDWEKLVKLITRNGGERVEP